MIKDPDFYTATLARVYEGQGYWEKAAEIYRHLLKQEPGRQDLAEALAVVEKKMDGANKKKPADLVPLFRKWIDLLSSYQRLQKLRKFKTQF